MSVIREVYGKLPAQKAEYSVDGELRRANLGTLFEQVNDIVDRLLGPSDYTYVSIMYAVADRLSERGFALAVTEPLTAYALLQASAEIGEAAQKLDNQLVDRAVDWFVARKQAN